MLPCFSALVLVMVFLLSWFDPFFCLDQLTKFLFRAKDTEPSKNSPTRFFGYATFCKQRLCDVKVFVELKYFILFLYINDVLILPKIRSSKDGLEETMNKQGTKFEDM